MINMTVDTPVRKKTNKMETRVVFHSKIECGYQVGITSQGTVGNGIINPHKIVSDDASRSDSHMSNFGVAHNTFRQSNSCTGGLKRRHRVRCEETIQERCFRQKDGIGLRIFSQTETVKDQKCELQNYRLGRFKDLTFEICPLSRNRTTEAISLTFESSELLKTTVVPRVRALFFKRRSNSLFMLGSKLIP